MNAFNQRNSLVHKSLSESTAPPDPSYNSNGQIGLRGAGGSGDNNCNCPKCRLARNQVMRRTMNSGKLKRLYAPGRERSPLVFKTQFFPKSQLIKLASGCNASITRGENPDCGSENLGKSNQFVSQQRQPQSPPRQHQPQNFEDSTDFLVRPRKLAYTPSPPAERNQEKQKPTQPQESSRTIQQSVRSNVSNSRTCFSCQHLIQQHEPCYCHCCRDKLISQSLHQNPRPKPAPVPDEQPQQWKEHDKLLFSNKKNETSQKCSFDEIQMQSHRSSRQLGPPGKPSAVITIGKSDNQRQPEYRSVVPPRVDKDMRVTFPVVKIPRNTTTAVLAVGANIVARNVRKHIPHGPSPFYCHSTPTCAYLGVTTSCKTNTYESHEKKTGQCKQQEPIFEEEDEDLLDEEDELIDDDDDYEVDYENKCNDKEEDLEDEEYTDEFEEEGEVDTKTQQPDYQQPQVGHHITKNEYIEEKSKNQDRAPMNCGSDSTSRLLPLLEKYQSEPCVRVEQQHPHPVISNNDNEAFNRNNNYLMIGSGNMHQSGDPPDFPSLGHLTRGFGITPRYMTDLQKRIYQAINIYVYRNGIESHAPVLIHIPPSRKKNMRSVMSVVQDRMKYPIGYAKKLYKMDGTLIRHPCELEMYNKYVVASSYQKEFKPVEYGRLKSPLLILGSDSKNIHVRNKKSDYERWKKHWKIHGPKYVDE